MSNNGRSTASTSTEPNWKKISKLLKKNRPYVRQFDLDKDLWLLWAHYSLGGFEFLKRDMDKQEFTDEILKYIANWSNMWLIEDDCRWFEKKRGPTGVIGVLTDGWKIEPHFEFFQWATTRLKLRGMVSFLNMVAKSKQIGVCIGRAPGTHCLMLDHIKHRYRLWQFVGKIPNGGPYGDEFIYTLKGAREPMKEH